MQFDPSRQSKADNYNLITSLVVPRPIAWITSLSKAGVPNLAPFSYFNVVGSDPPYVVVSIGQRSSGEPKDTARNIQDTGVFVVNLVTEELLAAMNISAADFPAEESEATAAGLDLSPGIHVTAPRLAAAQASLECRLHQVLPLGSNQLVIAEVVLFHVADQLLDPQQHVADFSPIGRLGSPSLYCRTSDRFEVPRLSHAQWRQQT
ncbi:flavin reductase family protein [Vulcanococcus limneticus]|uniref:flavin reductase family protein n=1 Tax=Vulcanococcus limneticus TaxID=2170428 RepID=UPI000B99742E|nr:flavin reductase family protein [Vulcanococcus limneticus]MCP9792229.1 flavin reductase family protein [Vulcanococcus limneticus MW73D5]MCP9897580.1 flavin reductase family protein [Vulcanococcus limneticus Candia 3B3]